MLSKLFYFVAGTLSVVYAAETTGVAYVRIFIAVRPSGPVVAREYVGTSSRGGVVVPVTCNRAPCAPHEKEPNRKTLNTNVQNSEKDILPSPSGY